MNVIECIKKNGVQMEVDSLKRYQTVDICFLDSDGNVDETEFTVKGFCTKAGNKELSDLFSDFCKENGFVRNKVISVTIVKSADTRDELE